ncbi:MAG: YihA family ribosome biogenesis GTP-binding protein [Deltaproteobacteria bacterium]|nr:YihA family ribosome biogenesis GTP-binding protein [Deltaproteobacteria bacterium]
MTRIVEAKLVSSAGKLEKLPEPSLPEVAFAGRSNVGKSSLLGALSGTRKLFKTSKTPGRTRTIVHAEARLDGGARFYLVDLPGYGYAKVSRAAKQAWAELMEAYLGDRPTLHLIVLLVDARRGPEGEEADLLEFVAEAGVPAMLVATKIDKVKKAQRKSVLHELRQLTGVDVIGVSATKKEGIERLLETIVEMCKLA